MTEDKSNDTSTSIRIETSRADNWLDLASHLQAKVLKRTSDVSYLQTRAGFLIAAAVIVLQVSTSLPKFTHTAQAASHFIAVVIAFTSLIFAIASMHVGKSTSPLNPDEMILGLTERPELTREQFGNWLAKSYAAANTAFNKEYNTKYRQQIIAAVLLVASFAIVITLKGIERYV